LLFKDLAGANTSSLLANPARSFLLDLAGVKMNGGVILFAKIILICALCFGVIAGAVYLGEWLL
jgi:hypothetical protein